MALLVAYVGAPGEVAAHAELRSSDPAPNAALVQAPDALTLEFSEPIDPSSGAVQLLLGHVAVEGTGPVAVREARLSVALPELAPGLYTVDYRVTSAFDGHLTSGTFAFLVDPTGILPAPAVAPTSEASATDLATTIARWVGLLGLLGLAGTATFWLAARRVVGDAPLPWTALAGLALVAFAGHAAVAGFPPDVSAPFGTTPFETAMLVILAATGLIGLLAMARTLGIGGARRGSFEPTDRLLLLAVAVGGLVALAGASFAGHPSAYGGPLFAALDFVHLAAVAAWLGVLPGAALLAWRARRGQLDGPSAGNAAAAALRGHARVALAAAPIVALTGIANSPLVLGAARGLVDSGYGNVLLGKALLFSTALALAAINFLLLRGGSVRRTVAVLAGEGLVGVVAVLLAASMVTLQPAAARAPAVAPSGIGTVHLYGEAGNVTIHVGVSRPSPGPQRYQLSVADAASGALMSDVQAAALIFTPPETALGEARRVDLQPQAGNVVWGAAGAYTPVIGSWRLEAVVGLADGSEATTSFDLPVAESPPAAPLPPPATGIGVPAPLALLYGLLPRGIMGWVPALALLGGAAALAAFQARGASRSRWLAGLRTALVALAVAAGLAAGTRTAVEAANAPPPDAAAATNPVPMRRSSFTLGQRLYVANCAACHGPDGTGDGPAAAGMLPPPGDLPTEVRESTDGELEYRIATGMAGTRMPPFAATLSEDERWDLVNYLRGRWGRAE